MPVFHKITPCLWFDNQAEQAAQFYTSIFPDSKIIRVTHFGKAGYEIHGRPAGSVMTVVFELEGQSFTALNGGPMFQFSESISFQIHCRNQEEVDYYWERLSEGGDKNAQQCGWLKDQFGVSWQVIPDEFLEMINDPDPEKSQRVTSVMLKMRKLNIDALRQAYEA